MKKILVLNGHPDKLSFNCALVDAYVQGAQQTDAEIEVVHIGELDFNPNLANGYRKRTDLEPDLLDAIEKLKWADHLVWVFPMWWASFPAVMKGFIDRTFLPGITYQPVDGKPLPQKLLKGKTARIIMTSDTPKWYGILYMKNPALNQMKKGVLKFCGVAPVKVTYISPIKRSTESFREKQLARVKALGSDLK